MRFCNIDLEATYREIVDTHQGNPPTCKVLSGFRGDVNKVGYEILGLPGASRVLGLEENALSCLNVMPLQLLGLYRPGILDLDDTGRPNSNIDRHFINTLSRKNEVIWRVHV